MRYLIIASATFDAGHHLPDSEVCDKPGHGHHWYVEAEASGEMGPRRVPHEERLRLKADLDDLSAELNGRNLNLMLPAAAPTPENIALQFMERLRSRWPRLTRVTVSHDEFTSVSMLAEDST